MEKIEIQKINETVNLQVETLKNQIETVKVITKEQKDELESIIESICPFDVR